MSQHPARRPDPAGYTPDPSHLDPVSGHAAGWLRCRHCGAAFSLAAPGTRHRNHCPHCLWSVHLDDTPGDRASLCRGGMEPIAIYVDRRGEWHIVHRCGTCRILHLNRVAGDDDERALLALALRPVANLPFPL